MLSVRKATITDAKAMLNIYAPYVTGTCISFETHVPTLEAFSARIEKGIKDYPYVVCEVGQDIVGFAYASRHRERAAYNFSADVSVYVSPAYHNRGIGKALYGELFALLKSQAIYMLFAGIALPNDASVGLHRSFGFKEVGVYHNVGYKFDKWLDVMWMEKSIKEIF